MRTFFKVGQHMFLMGIAELAIYGFVKGDVAMTRPRPLPEALQFINPAMAYISVTEPLVQRGPHEHETQADLFCFIGSGSCFFLIPSFLFSGGSLLSPCLYGVAVCFVAGRVRLAHSPSYFTRLLAS